MRETKPQTVGHPGVKARPPALPVNGDFTRVQRLRQNQGTILHSRWRLLWFSPHAPSARRDPLDHPAEEASIQGWKRRKVCFDIGWARHRIRPISRRAIRRRRCIDLKMLPGGNK